MSNLAKQYHFRNPKGLWAVALYMFWKKSKLIQIFKDISKNSFPILKLEKVN